MPPTRREQAQLDELLGDIYRGIEHLPDNNSGTTRNSNKLVNDIYARSHVRQYELPASSPLVKQFKQELRNSPASSNINSNAKIPQRSTLKRQQTPIHDDRQRAPQSLASFITNSPATPENRRRVRIVDKQQPLDDDQDDYEEEEEQDEDQPYNIRPDTHYVDEQGRLAKRGTKGSSQTKVKYVNTNKLIYHQERNPDDEQLSGADEPYNQDDDDNELDDELDGKTRVEYYHTTWLDRQLGRASKRRNSHELKERQVKEKAMIEELKRSLKNGAITLRQSFKGKKSSKSPDKDGFFNTYAGNRQNKVKSSKYRTQHLSSYDDSHLNKESTRNDTISKRQSSSVFGSGLATVPRNQTHQQRQPTPKANPYTNRTSTTTTTTTRLTKTDDYQPTIDTTPKQTYNYAQQQPTPPTRHQPSAGRSPNNYSSTLPSNQMKHQLLQSHYRGAEGNFNTIHGSRSPTAGGYQATPIRSNSYANRQIQQQLVQPQLAHQQPAQIIEDTSNMRNHPMYNNQTNGNCNTYGRNSKSPSQQQLDFALRHPRPVPATGNTINSYPSATEVVQSALSRSNSQVSLNQINKTINLLPTSPSLYRDTPTSPNQQLKACSPSLSPSPVTSPYNQAPQGPTIEQQKQQLSHDQFFQPAQRMTGSRITSPPAARPQPQQQQQIYQNPHASLMQHRLDQQMRQPNRNEASIREFNELDSLLRSLNPHSSTHITPGYSSRPHAPVIGGFGATTTVQQQPNQQHDTYARVQKQTGAGFQASPVPQRTGPGFAATLPAKQQNYASNISQQQPFIIDATQKKDESCLERQNLSEFEPPIELVPSMQDYQNISKLNPVKNHYWYKPNMSRDRAINLLKDKPQGTFIVRDSTSFRGAYGLAVKVSKLPKNVLYNDRLRDPNGDPSAELIRHFLIEPTGSGGVKLKGYANEPVFDSLPDLIYQHSLTEIALPCKLLIPRADIEDARFNTKQKQFFDEFVASRETAKHNPYEITTPDGGYRRYPGNVLVHNEHRIEFQ